MPGFKEYDRYDGLGLAELIRTRQVSPGEVCAAAIERVERLNPAVNAVVTRCSIWPDAPWGPASRTVLRRSVHAQGPVVGLRRRAAHLRCKALKNFIPDHDSELVRRYRQAGLVILGKTNTPEFGLVAYTEPELFGPTRNPWDRARTPGGSSGGSAAAVAAGMVPLAGRATAGGRSGSRPPTAGFSG